MLKGCTAFRVIMNIPGEEKPVSRRRRLWVDNVSLDLYSLGVEGDWRVEADGGRVVEFGSRARLSNVTHT